MSNISTDLTEQIERVRAFEEELGVRFEALYCEVEGPDDDDEYKYTLNGELYATSGTRIDADIDIILSIFDGKGRLIENESGWIDSDKFFGFQSFSLSTYSKLASPSRIRLYPKRS